MSFSLIIYNLHSDKLFTTLWFVLGLQSKTENLNIKWRSDGATPTNLAAADKKNLGQGATIGAAVGAGVPIIGMVALSGFALRRQTGGSD